ncbi:MAG: class I SAM-dependent methyltransferase [Elusimicrobiota bacterium]
MRVNTPGSLEDIVPEYRSGNPVVRWIFRRRLAVALELGELAGPDRMRVLDLGCGEAAFLRLAQRMFPQHSYVGWDIHPGISAFEVPGVELQRVDIRETSSLPSLEFDRIFCLDVLEHFQELEETLANIRRLLKPGGSLIVSEPTESVLYRCGRLLVKGTFSSQEGPCAGPHYRDAEGVDAEIRRSGFKRSDIRRMPPRPLDVFHLTKYCTAESGLADDPDLEQRP